MPYSNPEQIPQEVHFAAIDGFSIVGAFYQAETSVSTSSRVLIIGSAFGVPFQYYKHIARYFAKQGISVLTFDYRGISHSKKGSMPTKDMLMQHWGELDLEGAIQYIQQEYQPESLYYMGHSAGGQIVGLAPSSVNFDKMIIAASGLGSWRKWDRPGRYALIVLWYLIMPLVMFFQRGDYFHSKMLGPISVPKHVVSQWLRWGRSEEYLFSAKHGLNISHYKKIKAKVLGLTISDDWYAPESARDALLKHLPNAQQQTNLIEPKALKLKTIGHFGLFKKKQEIEQGIWQPMLNFLSQ